MKVQQVKPTTAERFCQGDLPPKLLLGRCASSSCILLHHHPFVPSHPLLAHKHTPLHWVHARRGQNPLCNRGRRGSEMYLTEAI